MKNEFVENVRWIKSRNVFVMENPVEFDLIQRLSEEECEEHVDVLAVGRLVREKAYDILLQSFAQILKKYPTRKLMIIGAGNQFDFITTLISDLKISDSIILMGANSNPYKYMKKSSLCVVSSRLEGFPNVLYEMMAVSNSVVATKCADGVQYLPGIYTAEVDSVASLANAMINAIEEDEIIKNENIFQMRDKVKKLTVENYLNNIFSFSNVIEK